MTEFLLGQPVLSISAASVRSGAATLFDLTPDAPLRSGTIDQITTGPINLSTEVSGVLNVEHGGSGSSVTPTITGDATILSTGTWPALALAAQQQLTTTSWPTFSNLNLSALATGGVVQTTGIGSSLTTGLVSLVSQVSGTLPVNSGGTGTTTAFSLTSGNSITITGSYPTYSVRTVQPLLTSSSPGFVGLVLSGSATMSFLSPSMPVFTDSSENLISKLVSLTSDISGILPAAHMTPTVINPTAGQITVSSAFPNFTIGIDATYLGQTSITTLGTIASGGWQGSVIGAPYLQMSGGTNITVSGTGVIATVASPAFTNITGTLVTAAQPNITSVGTLSGLIVNGLTVINNNRFQSAGGALQLRRANYTSSYNTLIDFSDDAGAANWWQMGMSVSGGLATDFYIYGQGPSGMGLVLGISGTTGTTSLTSLAVTNLIQANGGLHLGAGQALGLGYSPNINMYANSGTSIQLTTGNAGGTVWLGNYGVGELVRTNHNTLDDGTGAASITGLLTASAGISVATSQSITFNNSIVEGLIKLYGTTTANCYGFGVLGGTLVYNVDLPGSSHKFYVGGSTGTLLFTITGSKAVQTHNNILDDGTGNMTILANKTLSVDNIVGTSTHLRINPAATGESIYLGHDLASAYVNVGIGCTQAQFLVQTGGVNVLYNNFDYSIHTRYNVLDDGSGNLYQTADNTFISGFGSDVGFVKKAGTFQTISSIYNRDIVFTNYVSGTTASFTSAIINAITPTTLFTIGHSGVISSIHNTLDDGSATGRLIMNTSLDLRKFILNDVDGLSNFNGIGTTAGGMRFNVGVADSGHSHIFYAGGPSNGNMFSIYGNGEVQTINSTLDDSVGNATFKGTITTIGNAVEIQRQSYTTSNSTFVTFGRQPLAPSAPYWQMGMAVAGLLGQDWYLYGQHGPGPVLSAAQTGAITTLHNTLDNGSGAASLGSLTLSNPLPVASGGTGTASAPSLGSGTNISISGSWPSQIVSLVSTPTVSNLINLGVTQQEQNTRQSMQMFLISGTTLAGGGVEKYHQCSPGGGNYLCNLPSAADSNTHIQEFMFSQRPGTTGTFTIHTQGSDVIYLPTSNGNSFNLVAGQCCLLKSDGASSWYRFFIT